MSDNVAAYDLPRSEFPFTVELYDMDTGEVKYTQVVSEPGVLEIPSFHKLGIKQGRVGTRLTFPGGKVVSSDES